MFMKFDIFGICWSVFPMFTHALKLPKSLLINSLTLHHLESTVEAIPTASFRNDKGHTDSDWKIHKFQVQWDDAPHPFRIREWRPTSSHWAITTGSYWANVKHGGTQACVPLVGTGSPPRLHGRKLEDVELTSTGGFPHQNTAKWHSAGTRFTVPVHKLKHFCHFVILSTKSKSYCCLIQTQVCLRILDRPLKQIPENSKILISKQNIENLHWGAFWIMQHQQPFLRGQ